MFFPPSFRGVKHLHLVIIYEKTLYNQILHLQYFLPLINASRSVSKYRVVDLINLHLTKTSSLNF